MTTRADIDAFLSEPALAVVGVSRSGSKFGNYACRVLRDKGYEVYPVHPSADVIDGMRCHRSLADVPVGVNAVLVVVPPREAAKVVREAAAGGLHRIWLQQGAASPDVLAACAEEGVSAISGECILMFAQPAGFHRLHHSVWRFLRKLPA